MDLQRRVADLLDQANPVDHQRRVAGLLDQANLVDLQSVPGPLDQANPVDLQRKAVDLQRKAVDPQGQANLEDLQSVLALQRVDLAADRPDQNVALVETHG